MKKSKNIIAVSRSTGTNALNKPRTLILLSQFQLYLNKIQID